MTRINVIDPEELNTKMLVAEYRELPRIFNLVRAAILRGERPNDARNPSQYTLGSGHVRFFYPRLGWLVERQRSLIGEMLRRDYRPSYTDVDRLCEGIGPEWCQHWQPDDRAREINRARIAERLAGKSPK